MSYELSVNRQSSVTSVRRREFRRLLREYCRSFDLLPESVFVFDSRLQRILVANCAACRAVGFTRTKLLQASPRNVLPKEDYEAFAESIRRAGENRHTVSAFASSQRSKRGTVHAAQWKIKFVRKFQIDCILAISCVMPRFPLGVDPQGNDVTEGPIGGWPMAICESGDSVAPASTRHGLTELPLVLARPNRDALTGLPDRVWFENRLQMAIQRVRHEAENGFAVLFIDLDLFKHINDSLGHRAGDRALAEAAYRLTKAVRSCDLVARYGGDEFTILVEPIGKEDETVRLAERIIARMNAPFFIGNQRAVLAVSAGIAVGRRSDFSAESIIDRADAAMYRAKARGGSCYECSDEGQPSLARQAIRGVCSF
jgi:diguanylate cyclase (GGDEF)-like protein/PAS domain S-box-containing protein